MDYIYDLLDNGAPCRECENYGDGRVYDNGEDFHEFVCEGGHCIYCAEQNNFSCFEPVEHTNSKGVYIVGTQIKEMPTMSKEQIQKCKDDISSYIKAYIYTDMGGGVNVAQIAEACSSHEVKAPTPEINSFKVVVNQTIDYLLNERVYNQGEILDIYELDGFKNSYAHYYTKRVDDDRVWGLDWIPKFMVSIIEN